MCVYIYVIQIVCVYISVYSQVETTEPNCLYHLFHLDLMKKKTPNKTKMALQALLLQTWAEFQDNPERWCNESWQSWSGVTHIFPFPSFAYQAAKFDFFLVWNYYCC